MTPWTRVKKWLPSVLWAALIFGLSTDAFSSKNTSAVILPVLRWVFPHAGRETIELLHDFIRKLAHFTEYFVFGILLTHGFRGKERGWRLRWALWALAVAAGYSLLDEFHQLFVPSRGASLWDSGLDTVGASAGQIVLWLWHLLRGRLVRSPEKEPVVSAPD